MDGSGHAEGSRQHDTAHRKVIPALLTVVTLTCCLLAVARARFKKGSLRAGLAQTACRRGSQARSGAHLMEANAAEHVDEPERLENGQCSKLDEVSHVHQLGALLVLCLLYTSPSPRD